MVNDPENHELIRWSTAGDSFFVLDHERFAREVLGRWFKHQNFASFVRQLNMYGFHKIPHLQQGVLKSDSDTDFWNFAHPNFHRGRPELLCLIQRKKQVTQPGDEHAIDLREFPPPQPTNAGSGQVMDMQTIISGISAIQRHQSTITSELNELKRSNQLLWQEAMEARAKHQKQQDTINRIVKFLAGVFGQRTNPSKEDVIDSIQTCAVVPRKVSRFLIEDGRVAKVPVAEEQNGSDNSGHSVVGTPRETLPSSDPPPAADTPNMTARESSHSPDVIERVITPVHSPSPDAEFDRRIQVLLSQLTPSQLSQLISHTINPIPTEGHDHPASSQITQYNPPLADFFNHFSSSPVPPSAPMDHLLHLDSDPHTDNIAKSWKTVEDIDGAVEGTSMDIDSIVRSLGLENDKDFTATLDSSHLSANPPPIVTSLHTNTLHDMETVGLQNNSPDSSRPSPSDSMFDIESLFGFQDAGNVHDGLDPPFGHLNEDMQTAVSSSQIHPASTTAQLPPSAIGLLDGTTKTVPANVNNVVKRKEVDDIPPPVMASTDPMSILPTSGPSPTTTRSSKRRKK